KYPSQDCELKRGDKLKDRSDGSAGELISIDLKNQLVKIKKGPSIKDHHPASVYCLDDFPSTDKEESIIRIAEWICKNGIDSEEADLRCGRHLLLKGFP